MPEATATMQATAHAAPILTLNAQQEAAVPEQLVELLEKTTEDTTEQAAAEAIRKLDASLSEEERKLVSDFAKTIDITDPNHVMLYGADAQKKISGFADTVLGSVKTVDTGDVGEDLTKLVTTLKGFDASAEIPKKGLFGLFRKAKVQIKELQARYEDVATNVESISNELEGHQAQLLQDVGMFEQLYGENLEYFHELTLYIVAGEQRLKEVRDTDLKRLQEIAQKSEDALDAQKAQDLAAQCDRFEKKLYDLKLTRQISMQMAPQIRLLQNNNSLLIERIQSTIVNTLPLWKNQMVLALGLHHSKEAMKAQKAVTDMTNDLLKRNAETLKIGTIETAKESERGIIDVETLVQTNQSLIDTINEVSRIHEEGRQKRRKAEATLSEMERNLKQKLLTM